MLSGSKLKQVCKERSANLEQLAGHLVRGGLSQKGALSALKNWQKGLFKPEPSSEDVRKLASAIGVDVNEISVWKASHSYAPISPRKARLVTELVSGRSVQEALDVLKFTRKRAAVFVEQTLKSAVANADEQQADVENLYISEARVDSAGVRIGTKRWIAKDRGRAHSIRKMACHIHISVAQ